MQNVKGLIISVFCFSLLGVGSVAIAQDVYYYNEHEIKELEKKVEGLFQSGLMSLQNNAPKEALVYFQQVIDINPNDGGAYANMASANFYLQNYLEAIDNIDKAKKLGINGLEALENMLAPYRLRNYSIELYAGHIIQISGNTICNEQLIRDVLLAGLGTPTSIDAKFLSWKNEGEYWLETWEMVGNVSMKNVTISFYPKADGSTSFSTVENK